MTCAVALCHHFRRRGIHQLRQAITGKYLIAWVNCWKWGRVVPLKVRFPWVIWRCGATGEGEGCFVVIGWSLVGSWRGVNHHARKRVLIQNPLQGLLLPLKLFNLHFQLALFSLFINELLWGKKKRRSGVNKVWHVRDFDLNVTESEKSNANCKNKLSKRRQIICHSSPPRITFFALYVCMSHTVWKRGAWWEKYRPRASLSRPRRLISTETFWYV